MQRLVTMVVLVGLMACSFGMASFAAEAKKVGVMLAGSGTFDGSEVHEVVLTLLALKRQGAEVVCMAPNVEQMHVINHLTQQPTEETRNVLIESARIVWGNVKDIKDVSAEDVDALMIPGGFGVVKNLSTFATEGVNFTVNPEVERFVKDMLAAKKPMAAICIAPVVIAKIAGQHGLKPKLTIGMDDGTAKAIESLGAQHVPAQVTDVVVDADYKIVTSPAYMMTQNIAEVADGIEKTVTALLGLVEK